MHNNRRARGRVDHVAIAVRNLDAALELYRDAFGFEVLNQREIKGAYSGMKSAELDAGGFSIVLIEGTDPQSQVSRYVQEYGPGVQHIAIEVEDVPTLASQLRETGIQFATNIIRGAGLVQIFTRRDSNSGMMFEFINRINQTEGFEPGNIQQLFDQLEASETY
jgi:methylmalonyl-CoA epimerase